MSLFLAYVVINNPGSEFLAAFVKKLSQYKNVGYIIYARPREKNSPSHEILHTMILQLIVSKIIILSFDEATNHPQCSLRMMDAKPAYLDDKY